MIISMSVRDDIIVVFKSVEFDKFEMVAFSIVIKDNLVSLSFPK